MNRDLTLGEAARAIGVSQDTLRRWDRAGKLRTHRDERNRRRVAAEEVHRLTPRRERHATGARLSPDSKTVALAQWESGARNSDIWLMDLTRNLRTHFTFDPGIENAPAWSPDGRTIVYRSTQNHSLGDLYAKPADGSKSGELLFSDSLQKTHSDPKGPYH